ncbi:MAG: tRNA (guanosine(46)-N7)-methyltransferase TrmB [Alistipes sp.]|nr:tRNA (guanosine(46)-N7)-methyltransferase TrmB [Alistipes sp.]
MGKNKHKRFQENLTFANLVQPEFGEIFHKDHPLKGKWKSDFFGNDRPLVLELGCGRGEYTVALGEMFPDRNFIGIDIKGARMWRGAKTATENGMANVGFLRTRIEFINSFFGPGEVDEVWITFPDPQLKKNRVKKRLTAPQFLEMYSRFVTPDTPVHLKTDCLHLHRYTKAVAEANGLRVISACDDIYGKGFADEVLSVKTTYEQKFLAEGMAITYIAFTLGDKKSFAAPDFEPDNNLSL